jgi:ketosteroid isomerase-like protein
VKALLLFVIALIWSSASLAEDSEGRSNTEIIDRFFATVFTDTAEAKSLLHDDFSFQFMGICTICKSYNKETFITEWLGKDIPSVLPTGVDLEIVRKIDGGSDVVYIAKGKAQGINGSYNNNYAMVFTIEGGQILDFQEYHSDLLAETRLHKKQIVDVE